MENVFDSDSSLKLQSYSHWRVVGHVWGWWANVKPSSTYIGEKLHMWYFDDNRGMPNKKLCKFSHKAFLSSFFFLYCLYFFVWFHFKGAPRMHAFVGIKWLQEIHNTSLRCWIVLLLLLQLLLLLPNRNELDSVIPYLSSTTRPSPTSEPFSYTVFVTWFYFLIFPIFFRLGRQNDLWNYPKSHVNLLTDSLFYSFFCFPIS